MIEVVIEKVAPYDGRYPLDMEADLTTREWGWIKRLSGYLPLTLEEEAFGDPELGCVLAAIALRRAGRISAKEVPAAFETLIDAPFGSAVTIEGEPEETEEEDAGPPARSSNGSESISGEPSKPSSERSPTIQSVTGTGASATSRSAPATSES